VRGDFLFWALQSKQAREAFSNAAGGVTRFGLTLDGMKSVRLACPDLPTQKAIANFLDRETARIDQLIEKKQQLVELLAEAHATRSEALLSGRSYGTGVATNGRSGHIRFLPDGWTETRLRFGIRRIEQGWSPQCEDRQVEGDDWGVLKLGAITTGEFVERAHKALPPDIAPITTYAVRAGDVLVARASGSPALVGKACLVDRVTRNLMLSDKHFRIELDPLRFDRSFFVHALNSPLGRSQIEARLSSAEGMARNIGQEVIRGLWLAVPPRDEQSKIATNIDTSASRVAATSQSIARSIDRLREFRAALITAAVTGQIDVATWSKRGEPDRRLDAIQREMAS
jgi:type I restriction enzyme S subunit